MSADLERLLKLTKRPGYMSVCHRDEKGIFKTSVVRTDKAAAAASQAADSGGGSDVWISFGRIAGPARKNKGRGTAKDVQALTALQVDVDVKVGGMPSMEAAWAVVHDLSTILGVEPAAVIMSGHGLQPWFVLDGADPDWACDGADDPRWAAIVVASRRWGRLLADVARTHGGAVDTVSDVSRVMRCPGTINYKDRDNPVPVTVEKRADQAPITYRRLVQVLDEYGVDGFPEDREVAGEVVVARGDWAWTKQSCPYALAMTRGWASDTPRAVDGLPGARHPWLVAQAVRLAAAHRHGCLTAADHAIAVSTLSERFSDVVADPHLGDVRHVVPGEVSDALSWGVRLVEAMSDADIATELGEHVHLDGPGGQPTGIDNATGARHPLVDLVFDATPELAYIRRLSHARLVSPWPVLAGFVANVLAESPPGLRVPAFVGTPASLNSFFAIVGPSGSGKTAGADVAREAFGPMNFVRGNPSSGEGIIALFASTSQKGEHIQHTTNVLSVVDEVATLGAQQERQGSTLASILRSAWSGSALSTHAAERSRQRHLEADSYRYVMVMGVQPATAGVLLKDSGSGTPQRVIWLPAQYAAFPEEDVTPGENPFENWMMPVPGSQIAYPEYVRDLVRSNRLAAVSGNVAALDGHALLARLKFAAGLALLHGSATVSDQLWEVSGHVMALSDHTRQQLLGAQAAQNRQRQESRGRDEATREEAKGDLVLEKAVKVLARYVHKHPEGVTRKAAKSACGRYKTSAVEAMNACLERGLIVEESAPTPNGLVGHRYLPGPMTL